MNHIGSGQEWDLELGEGGLEFLTPFAMGHNGSYRGKLEALDSAMNFLKISTEEYVVLADSGVLCAINLEKIVEAHAASGAGRHRRGEGRHLQRAEAGSIWP